MHILLLKTSYCFLQEPTVGYGRALTRVGDVNWLGYPKCGQFLLSVMFFPHCDYRFPPTTKLQKKFGKTATGYCATSLKNPAPVPVKHYHPPKLKLKFLPTCALYSKLYLALLFNNQMQVFKRSHYWSLYSHNLPLTALKTCS